MLVNIKNEMLLKALFNEVYSFNIVNKFLGDYYFCLH